MVDNYYRIAVVKLYHGIGIFVVKAFGILSIAGFWSTPDWPKEKHS